ncbi:MAG: biotin transporter BioY [Oscillospiraceae bacterium]
MKNHNENKKYSTMDIVMTGLFAAVIAVLSQIAIPMPSGVPVTLQTFAIALTGYFLGKRNAFMSAFIYVLVGAVGMPVFANFKGGIAAITGVTGGFIIGFIFMALLCGIGSESDNRIITIALGIAGLIVDHLFGVIQFTILTDKSFVQSLLVVSVPYLLKDVISVVIAYVLGVEVKKRIPVLNK